MSALRLTDWRRCIATLCVVLTAFVMVERAFASDPCHGLTGSVSYNIADTAVVTDIGGGASDDGGSLPAQQQHHCCSAHVSGMPPSVPAGAIVQTVERVQPLLRDAPAPNGEQGGPDRPPRTNAIV